MIRATVLATLTDPARPAVEIDRTARAFTVYPYVTDVVRVVTAYDLAFTLEAPNERALSSAVLRIQRAAPIDRTLTLTHVPPPAPEETPS